MKHWILEGHTPKPVDLMTWANWFEKSERHVADSRKGDVRVSTVFLGIDHRYGGNGPPLLFETMIFGGPHNEWQDRCSTWKEALEMHANACELAGVPYKAGDE